MNRNFLGLPTEGCGKSQNLKVIFKLPSFEEAKIKINKKITEIINKINS